MFVIAKLADAVTTIVGLSLSPAIVESNQALVVLIDAIGVIPAVVLGSVTVVGLVIAATDLGTRMCVRLAPRETWAVPAIYVVGYGPLSVVFLGAALHNSLLIGRVVAGVG